MLSWNDVTNTEQPIWPVHPLDNAFNYCDFTQLWQFITKLQFLLKTIFFGMFCSEKCTCRHLPKCTSFGVMFFICYCFCMCIIKLPCKVTSLLYVCYCIIGEYAIIIVCIRLCDMLHMTCVEGCTLSSKEKKAWIMVVLPGRISKTTFERNLE